MLGKKSSKSKVIKQPEITHMDPEREAELVKLIKKLSKEAANPVIQDYERQGIWIKEKAQEVKELLKILLHQPEGVRSRFDLLDKLSEVRQQLTDLNKKRRMSKERQPRQKNPKVQEGRISQQKKMPKTPKSVSSIKSRISQKSQKSIVSQRSQQTKSVQSSKSRSKSKQKLLKKISQNTPRFNHQKKRAVLARNQNELGSFAKPLSDIKYSGKKGEVLYSSNKLKKSPSSGVSEASPSSYKLSQKQLSRSSSKNKNMRPHKSDYERSEISSSVFSQEQMPSIRQYTYGRPLSKPSKLSINKSPKQMSKKSPKLKSNRSQSKKKEIQKKFKLLLDSSSSEEDLSIVTPNVFETNRRQDTIESSISLPGELQQTLAVLDAKNSQKQLAKDVQSRYKQFLEKEQYLQNNDSKQMDEETLLACKLDQVNKEKLLREFRVLFYRNKEVRKLLKEYYDANTDLVEQLDSSKLQMNELYDHYKQAKSAIRQEQKLNEKYQEQMASINKDLSKTLKQQQKESNQQQQYQDEIEMLREANDDLVSQVTMLKDAGEQQQFKLQQQEQVVAGLHQIINGKDSSIKELGKGNYQELYFRNQQEIENFKDQLEKAREETLFIKVQLEQQKLRNNQSEQQLLGRNEEIGALQNDNENLIAQLKIQLLAANAKAQSMENQIGQQRFSETNLQEQLHFVRDSITKLEEDLRISILKLDNREKELQECKSKELNSKKRIIELETQLQLAQSKINLQEVQFPKQVDVDKTNHIQKELASERLQHQKTQQDNLTLRHDTEVRDRIIKELETRLQSEQQDKMNLRNQLITFQQQNDNTVSNLQIKLKGQEKNNQKEIVSAESTSRNLELILSSQQARIQDLEMEMIKQIAELKQKDLQIQIINNGTYDKQAQLGQVEDMNTEYINELKCLRREKDELSEQIRQLKSTIDEQQREVNQMERLSENYKSKYLSLKYQNKKIKQEFENKENTMKNNYSTQIEQVNLDRDNFERHKKEDDLHRQMKDKKLKVISDIQGMIKQHKHS